MNVPAARELGLEAHRHTGAAGTIEAIEVFLG